MKVTVLGSGTSTGVPVPGCNCAICLSDNPKNKRLRTSIYLSGMSAAAHGAGSPDALPAGLGTSALVIDTGPDFRYQALRAGFTKVDAVLYTHKHADHIFGIDDLRPFNFINNSSIPLFADERTAAELESKFHYCFFPDPEYEGGASPKLTLTRITPYEAFTVCGLEVLPLPIMHGKLQIIAYKIGNFAYLTDCSAIPDQTREHLYGLDTIILSALRERPHKTHLTLKEAVVELEKIRPQKSYLTHLSHEVDHDDANRKVQESTDLDVEVAYDGLTFDIR